MAKQRAQRRAERRQARFESDLGLMDLEFTKQDEPLFINVIQKLSTGGKTMSDLTDDEVRAFLRYQMSPSDPAKLKSLIEQNNKLPGAQQISPERVTAIIEEGKKLMGTPQNRNRILDISQKMDIANKTSAFSNATGLLLAAADVGTAQRQIQEFKRRSKELQRPSRPGPMPADPYLDAAKKAAERGTYGESIAAQAARQQSLDAYQKDIQNAAVASTGQAGGYGALAQVATTRLGRRGAEMAPQIEAIRQGREQQRAQMAGMSSQENAARYESMAKMYPYDLAMYQKEAQAVGELGAAGYQNLRTGMQEVGDYLPGMAARAVVGSKYDKLRSALMSRGMSADQADKMAQAGTSAPDYGKAPVIAPTQGGTPFMASAGDIGPGTPYGTTAASPYTPAPAGLRYNVPAMGRYPSPAQQDAARPRYNIPPMGRYPSPTQQDAGMSSGFANWPTADQLRQQYPLEQYPTDTGDYMNSVPQRARRYKNPYQY